VGHYPAIWGLIPQSAIQGTVPQCGSLSRNLGPYPTICNSGHCPTMWGSIPKFEAVSCILRHCMIIWGRIPQFGFNLSGKSSVFCICLFDMKITEDGLKEIEAFWSLSGLYVRAYVLIHVLVLIFYLLNSSYFLREYEPVVLRIGNSVSLLICRT